MAPSAVSRVEDDGSGDDNRRGQDTNNRAAVKSRVNSRMRAQQSLQRLHQLRAENEVLEKKLQLLVKEKRFLKTLYTVTQGGTINLPSSVLQTLLRDATSDVLEENDL